MEISLKKILIEIIDILIYKQNIVKAYNKIIFELKILSSPIFNNICCSRLLLIFFSEDLKSNI